MDRGRYFRKVAQLGMILSRFCFGDFFPAFLNWVRASDTPKRPIMAVTKLIPAMR